MKKISFLLVLLFLLTNCNQQTYSFKEVTSFEVSNITQMKVSSSVYQSLAWIVDEKYYSYLDCSYILVSFDIDEHFMGRPPKESKDDAIVIHLERPHPSYKKYYAPFFILVIRATICMFNLTKKENALEVNMLCQIRL